MRRPHQIILVSAIALCLSAAVSAQKGDTLITDPALLKRLGFAADARNVYLAKGAVLGQKSAPADPGEFGTADFGWTTVLGSQHLAETSDLEYATNAELGLYELGAATGTFSAQLLMPSGALLEQAVWFGRDDDSDVGSWVTGTISRVCQTGIPIGPPVVTVLASGNSSSDSGDFIFGMAIPPGEVVDNLRCVYVARTTFGDFGPALVLRKVIAGWRRQVSPAPAVATFPNDTPTTHPYFRFIEALAAAGITGGCAPGSYCPNSPITRGEMAVFLSVALGLHFAN
jgi:hypothetical protein